MFRYINWRFGGAVSRVSAAAASAASRKVKAPRAASARGRKSSKVETPTKSRSPTRPLTGDKSKPRGRGRPPSKTRVNASSGEHSKPPSRISRSPPHRTLTPPKTEEKSRKASTSIRVKAALSSEGKEAQTRYAAARPANMSAEREQEVLKMAERMQAKDMTTEVPVASFAYEILTAHPSVRDMGLRERMDFLLKRWNKLSQVQRLDYINNPLRGLM